MSAHLYGLLRKLEHGILEEINRREKKEGKYEKK